MLCCPRAPAAARRAPGCSSHPLPPLLSPKPLQQSRPKSDSPASWSREGAARCVRMELLDPPVALVLLPPLLPLTHLQDCPIPVLVSSAAPTPSCSRRGTWCTKQLRLHIRDPFPDFSLLLMALKGFSHTFPPHPTPEMMEALIISHAASSSWVFLCLGIGSFPLLQHGSNGKAAKGASRQRS